MKRISIRTLCAAVLPCLALMGCGGDSGDAPDMGEVEGTVTLDGTALSGATLTFQPEDGRPSTGTTDEVGHYELTYTRELSGAMIGKHTVTISTFNQGSEDDPDDTPQAEKVPANYHGKDTPVEDVLPGENTIDFDLKGGEVVQPEGDDC